MSAGYSVLVQTVLLSAKCQPTLVVLRRAQGSSGKKQVNLSVKHKGEQYGRRSMTDVEVWHHGGMP